MSMISVFGSQVGPEEIEEIKSSINNQWMGIGPKTKKFEDEFAKRLGLQDFTLLDSGSNALYMAVKILNLPPKSEVIVPSFTWISCAHAVVLANCIPIFCDVDLRTYNITRKTIEPQLTKKTKAIMIVHYAGKPVELDKIKELGLPIIEDTAHAVDSKYKGKACGGIGDIGIYSFDAVKNLAMPEGGGITIQNRELMEKTKLLRYCGIAKSGFEASRQSNNRWWEYNIIDFYPKLIPNDICASIGLAQLKKLDRLQKRRKQIWDLYQKEFSNMSWLIRPCDAESDEQHSYFTYAIRALNHIRDKLAQYLYDNGVYTTLRYHPLHMNPIYKSKVHLSICEQLNEEVLSIPLHPNLTDNDVLKIIDLIKQYDKTQN
jgi:dTDP-4-amino-4,6-dideoxygalactose transaminase